MFDPVEAMRRIDLAYESDVDWTDPEVYADFVATARRLAGEPEEDGGEKPRGSQ